MNEFSDRFIECAYCRSQMGVAGLCDSCLNNRRLISFLEESVIYWRKKFEDASGVTKFANILKES